MNTLALLPYSLCSGSSLPLNAAWSVLYNEIFITLWYFHIWFTLRFLWNLNFKTCVRNLLVLHLKTRSVAYSPEWNSILWFIKIRSEHKGTNFQHLELWGVTFHLGLKQTKSMLLFWLFCVNDDGRRNLAVQQATDISLNWYSQNTKEWNY